jgi:hypothetical protein
MKLNSLLFLQPFKKGSRSPKNSLLFMGLLILVTSWVVIGNAGDGLIDDGKEKWDRSHTRAICDGNKCVDYLVYCNQGEFLDMKAISDVVIFGDNWVDERVESSLC